MDTSSRDHIPTQGRYPRYITCPPISLLASLSHVGAVPNRDKRAGVNSNSVQPPPGPTGSGPANQFQPRPTYAHLSPTSVGHFTPASPAFPDQTNRAGLAESMYCFEVNHDGFVEAARTFQGRVHGPHGFFSPSYDCLTVDTPAWPAARSLSLVFSKLRQDCVGLPVRLVL